MMLDNELIRVLGPIDVMKASGQVIGVGGRQTRALLGALVVGAGRAVPIDQLREVFWGDDSPPSADNTLQSYVSHLRQILGADTVARVDHSYRLNARENDIDALRFESLIMQAGEARAQPLASQALCREALHLWRGRPFGDLADDEYFKLETYRLDELRLLAMELSLDADLTLGHHDVVVGELEAAVQEHPYRERLWYLLIRALAGSNRRVEALRACASLRRLLAEVGLEANDELVELEQETLNGR